MSKIPTPMTDAFYDNYDPAWDVVPGMTLRDWFAGNASDADIAEYMPNTIGELNDFKRDRGFSPTREWAKYQYTDAMLKARES